MKKLMIALMVLLLSSHQSFAVIQERIDHQIQLHDQISNSLDIVKQVDSSSGREICSVGGQCELEPSDSNQNQEVDKRPKSRLELLEGVGIDARY